MPKESPVPPQQPTFLPKEQFEAALTHALKCFLKLDVKNPIEQAELLVEVKNSVGMVLASLREEAAQAAKAQPVLPNGEHKEETPLPQ